MVFITAIGSKPGQAMVTLMPEITIGKENDSKISWK